MISSQKKPEAATTQVRRVLQRTCMKKRMTSAALVHAMSSITMLFNGPRSTSAAPTVRPVPTIRARKTITYIDFGATCPLMPLTLEMAADEIQQREEENPDDVDEVPVEAGDFDRSVVLLVEGVAPRH